MRWAMVSLILLLAGVSVPHAADDRTLEEPPRYGVYYERYEPYFYTGFAPRTLDPRRLHLHLGRGNQLRATVVLSDEALAEYARDLQARARSYRRLVGDGRLVPTQNRGLEEFDRTLAEVELERLVAEESRLSAAELRERNLRLLERLNPGRVFRIHMPVDEVYRRWAAEVRPADRERMDAARALELVNLMLPTRLFAADLDAATRAQLAEVVACSGGAPETCRPAFLALLERVTHGMYPARDGVLRFDEFTAIWPVGSLNDTTPYQGRRIPAYPTTGRRALTTHQRTLTVDHVPTDVVYSYAPWLPYIHIGPRMHDAIHTLYWQMEPEKASFLPAPWRAAAHGSRDGGAYRYLWLLSRGPMSHGCTHLNAGHIAELRQLLPSETEQLYQVDVFFNTAPRYDVFDIDGDLTPEVMGVRYFIAYSLDAGSRPDRLRVRNERHAYYDWLYAGEVAYDAADHALFPVARDCRYVGRVAVDGSEYQRIPLYEAEYSPETIQFYRLVDIPFARELRKVSARYPGPAVAPALVSTR